MRARSSVRVAGAIAAVSLGVTACSPASPSASGAATLTVSAASSLTEAFTEIGRAFGEVRPGASVRFNFGGSSSLAAQIVEGAPVDVFASAGPTAMQEVIDARMARDPLPFASNQMAIATPPGNPAGIASVADLARLGVTLVVCQSDVPCGVAAERILARAGIEPTPVSLEPDVKSVLGKVAADEVDAGIVYVTDVRAAGDAVTGVTIPRDQNESTVYPIATVIGSQSADAQPFVDFVMSTAGQAILERYGFDDPA